MLKFTPFFNSVKNYPFLCLCCSDNNRFLQGLPHNLQAVEREPLSLTVQVKDPEAPVSFYIGGKKVSSSDSRCEIENKGNGVHTLHIHNCKMSDLGTLEARTPDNRGGEVSLKHSN